MENNVYKIAKSLGASLSFSYMGGRFVFTVEKDGFITTFRDEGLLRAWLKSLK